MSLGTSHSSRLSAPGPAPEGSAGVAARVAELVSDLRPDSAGLLDALHRIQHEFGYVPQEAIPVVAGKLRTTPALIYGAIGFYSEIRTTPPAEHVVEWCSGPACLLRGSLNIRRALEAVLGCEMNSATPDGRFELRLVQCDGTCRLAPQIRHKGRYIGPLSVSQAIEWARTLKSEHGPAELEGQGGAA